MQTVREELCRHSLELLMQCARKQTNCLAIFVLVHSGLYREDMMVKSSSETLSKSKGTMYMKMRPSTFVL